MRGARGIEFGVDLPAIPSIGLGSVLPTSSKRDTPPTAQGDGWGFVDWTRFVGAWKMSKSETATRDKDKTTTKSQDQTSLAQSQSQLQPQRQEHETPNEESGPERLASDDDATRSSTDKLSAVFDWLIERVPAPNRMLSIGSGGDGNGAGDGDGDGRSEAKADLTRKEPELDMKLENLEKQITDPVRDEKELSALAVSHTVGHGVSSGTISSSTSTSEMKRRMDSEKASLKKKSNELGSKDDLERFYVALTRKMYDEGL